MCAVYRIDNSIFTNKDADSIAVHDVLSIQEPILTLLCIPHWKEPQRDILMAVGKYGGVAVHDPSSMLNTGIANTISIEESIQSAFIAQDYLYLLTLESRVLRLLTRSIWSANSEDVECMDLPLLSALAPIMDGSGTEGFYGLTLDGHILAFPTALTHWKISELRRTID
ncbi:hypothetical protein BGZ51_004378 [Haplosporangium sp. Z 767]|nr:hypothetical protein BGZ51_004378 [Haplosporangium sp. Z 767]